MPEPDDPAKALEARALALLARREYTRLELARRLARQPAGKRAARHRAAADLADEFAPPPPATCDDPDPEFDLSDRDQAAALQLRNSALIEVLLDALAARGLLSDARAAEAIVHARASSRGLMRVQQELERKGVPDDVARSALSGLREQQLPLAREVWRKRFGVLPGDAPERARQTRFLASRGFSFEVIRAVLGGDTEA